MWERNGWEGEVALYVRTLALAEHSTGRSVPLALVRQVVSSRTLVRQFLESLGISGDGLRRNRWIIDHDAEPISVQKGAEIPVASDKERFLRVVTNAG
jgi:hypothetical protein